jgi:hypothetical protein
VRLVLCFSLPAYGGRKYCEDFPFLVTYTFLNPSEADFPQLPQLTDKLASTVQQKQPESRSTQLPMFYDSVAMTPRPLPLHHSYPRLLKKIPQQHITSPTPNDPLPRPPPHPHQPIRPHHHHRIPHLHAPHIKAHTLHLTIRIKIHVLGKLLLNRACSRTTRPPPKIITLPAPILLRAIHPRRYAPHNQITRELDPRVRGRDVRRGVSVGCGAEVVREQCGAVEC